MFSINFEHVLQWISFLLIICQVSAFCCCLFWLFLPEVLIELSILLCSHQIKLQSKTTLNNYNKNNRRTQQNTKNLSASKRKKQQKANKEKNNKNKRKSLENQKPNARSQQTQQNATLSTPGNTVDILQHWTTAQLLSSSLNGDLKIQIKSIKTKLN